MTEFHANHKICDPITGENLLHICFKKSLKLRFHFTVEYPSLLHQCDNNGTLPLIFACEQEDTVFLKWLFREFRVSETPIVVINSSFGSIEVSASSAEQDVMQQEVRMSRTYTNETVDFKFEAGLENPVSPSAREVQYMQPFAAGENGKSILHILAEKGLVNILSIIVQVCNSSFIEDLDLSPLSVRQNNSLPLPIENALIANNLDCIQILIDLAISSYQLPALMQDKNILKFATVTKNIESIKALIKFGFHAGVDLAITLAATYNLDDILHLLLLWKVHIQSYTNFSNNRNDVKKYFSLSHLTWKQLELQAVDPCWLLDALNALKATAGEIAKFMLLGGFQENCLVIFQELGEKCVEYFEADSNGAFRISPAPVAPANLEYTKIVKINLSENHLERVPRELFQLASLTYLDLKYNKIKYLPTSEDYSSNFFSAKLETLCLDYNELTFLPNDMMWGLAHSLTSLSVQKNRLEEIPPGLWLMPKLKILKLAKNCLSRLHYFSSPYFFSSADFSAKVSSIEVKRDGSLKTPLMNLDEKETDILFSHIRNLVDLLYTINLIQDPDTELQVRDLLNEVILLFQPSIVSRDSFDADEILTPTCSSLDSSLKNTFTSSLILLDLSFNNFTGFPWDLPCIAPNLGKLEIVSNSIERLDIVHDMPINVGSVNLTCNKIVSLCQTRSVDLPCGCPTGLFNTNRPDKEQCYCKHSKHEILEKLSRLILDNNLLNYIPILKILRAGSRLNEEFPSDHRLQANPLFPELGILSIASNRFTGVPEHLHHIKRLSSLDLSHNDIQELSEEMGLMNTDYINFIKLDGINPRNVPDSVLKSSSSRRLVRYLKDLKQRFVMYTDNH